MRSGDVRFERHVEIDVRAQRLLLERGEQLVQGEHPFVHQDLAEQAAAEAAPEKATSSRAGTVRRVIVFMKRRPRGR